MELSTIPGWQITALDQSLVALGISHGRLLQVGTSAQQAAVSHQQGKLSGSPIESNSMDAVLAFNVLEQIPDLKASLVEVRYSASPSNNDLGV